MQSTLCNALQRTAPHAATHSKEEGLGRGIEWTRTNDAVHTLQRTATHCTTCCNTLHKALQHTATYCHMLQHPATPTDECKEATADACVCGDLIRCYSSITCYSSTSHDSYARMATHCNTLQHTATLYNTLQHPQPKARRARLIHVCRDSTQMLLPNIS